MSLTPSEVFSAGKKIILVLEDENVPLRFHPWVLRCDRQQIVLELPDQWWKLITFLPDMRVEMSTVREECIFGLKGKIVSASHNPPYLVIAHHPQLERIQRRRFFRLECRVPVHIKRIILPEGNERDAQSAQLEDLSAEGAGFKISEFLPLDTTLIIPGLLGSLLPHKDETAYTLKIRWCQVNRPEGYRAGARFEFEDDKDYDRMARIINRLQVRRLSRYHHVLGQP